MYFSYLCLFAVFFYNLYLAPGARYALFPAKAGKSEKDGTPDLGHKRENRICGGEGTIVELNAALSHVDNPL